MHSKNLTSFQKFIHYSPILTSDNDWDKFDLLSDFIKDKLSFSTQIIKKISHSFNLEIEQTGYIALAVRKFYLKDLAKEEIPNFISQNTSLDPAKIQKIFQIIKEKIIDNKTVENNYHDSFDSLPLKQALEKYPHIKEQLIGEGKIRIKNFPEPVRSSINNWLTDYTFNLGYEKHNAIQRSQYLFNGENGRTLNQADRKKLSFLLKALDENLLISVNKKNQNLLFANPQKKNPPKNTAIETNVSNIQKTEFDFKQKMPQEIKKTNNLPPYRITPRNISAKKIIDTRDSSNKNQPKNLVNLKEE